VPPGQCSTAADPVRVVIADDDHLFAAMLRARLSAHPDFDVVGIADDGRAALALAEQLEPDLVLMDLNMPAVDGIEATRRICALPAAPRVVLVTGEDQESDGRAYAAGASAYLRKSPDMVALIDVIVAVAQLSGV
jgi:DNA-binding NarL/FixJ family response regulator